MRNALRQLLICSVAVVAAAGCDYRSVSNTLAPSPSSLGISDAAPSYLGTWRSVAVSAPASMSMSRHVAATSPLDPSTCGSFTWTVDSQTATHVSGQFSVICNSGSVVVTGSGTGTLTSPTTVTLTVTASGTVPGIGACPVSVSANGTLNGEILTLQYAGTTCVAPLSGSVSLSRKDLYPDPPTQPAQEPPPPPPPASGGSASADTLDLGSVTIALGADIRNWAVTSTLTSASFDGRDLCTFHTMAGRGPQLPGFGYPNVLVEGNQWMFANNNGKWYGGAGEWLRPGQECKNVEGHIGQGAFTGTIMQNWTPAPGELVGLAVSTPARAGQWGSAERSNVVLIHW
jgi:hypothetical protein